MSWLLAARARRFSQFSLEKVYAQRVCGKKTKIVATMGPSTRGAETLRGLLDAGLNVFRLNFSHGDHASQLETLREIRAADRQARPFGLPLMMDLKGPSVRTGFLRDGKSVALARGQPLTLTTDYDFVGSAERVAVSYAQLPATVGAGDTIYAADGTLSLRVTAVDAAQGLVHTTVLNDFLLGERKNVNLPGKRVDIPTLTEKDRRDLREFALPHHVDMVSVSFCRSAADVAEARALLGAAGRAVKIVAKIENHEGLDNLDEILRAADALMVARGDLGMEIPPEKVPIAQKWMLRKCAEHRRPAITATQMLESMVGAARPTRAEVGDVFNAVLEGTHCVMLSGETSAGKFPREAVAAQRRIAVEAEACADHAAELAAAGSAELRGVEPLLHSAATLCNSAGADLMVVLAKDAAHVHSSAFFPSRAFVMAPFADERALRFFEVFRGVHGVKCAEGASAEERVRASREFAAQLQLLPAAGEAAVVVVDCEAMSCRLLRGA